MVKSCWQVLGIPASSDQRAVRRAYAVLLKKTNPEDDPAGFQILRAAYEQAMSSGKRFVPPNLSNFVERDDYFDEDETDADADADAVETTDGLPFKPSKDFAELQSQTPDALPDAPKAEPPAGSGPLADSPKVRPNTIEARNQRNLKALCDAVYSNGTPFEVMALFQAVIEPEVMENIKAYSVAEAQIFNLLDQRLPAATVFFERAFIAFGWDKEKNRGHGSVAEMAVQLRYIIESEAETQDFINRIKNKKHEYYPAWLEASQDPAERSFLSKTWGLTRLSIVQRFFGELSFKPYTVWANFNDDAIDWLSDRVAVVLPRIKIATWIGYALIILAAVFSVGPQLLDNGAAVVGNGKSSLSYIKDLQAEVARAPENVAVSRQHCQSAATMVPGFPSGPNSLESPIWIAENRPTSGGDFEMRQIALAICRDALKLRPESLVLQNYLGLAKIKDADFSGAIADFENMLKVSPIDQIALMGLAHAKAGAGSLGDAITYARQANAIGPEGLAYYESALVVDTRLKDIKDDKPPVASMSPAPRSDTQADMKGNIDQKLWDEAQDYFGTANLPTSGSVKVECAVGSERRFKFCRVLNETPSGRGLAEIVIHALKTIPVEPYRLNGKVVEGGTFIYTMTLGQDDTAAPPSLSPANDVASNPLKALATSKSKTTDAFDQPLPERQ